MLITVSWLMVLGAICGGANADPKVVGNKKDSEQDGTVVVVNIQDHNKTQYLNQNFEEGNYNYGYDIKPFGPNGQFHHENKAQDNVVYGCYGYLDPNDENQLTFYISDAWGYRPVKQEQATEIFYPADNPEGTTDMKGTLTPWSELVFPDKCAHFAEQIASQGPKQGQKGPAPLSVRAKPALGPLRGTGSTQKQPSRPTFTNSLSNNGPNVKLVTAPRVPAESVAIYTPAVIPGGQKPRDPNSLLSESLGSNSGGINGISPNRNTGSVGPNGQKGVGNLGAGTTSKAGLNGAGGIGDSGSGIGGSAKPAGFRDASAGGRGGSGNSAGLGDAGNRRGLVNVRAPGGTGNPGGPGSVGPSGLGNPGSGDFGGAGGPTTLEGPGGPGNSGGAGGRGNSGGAGGPGNSGGPGGHGNSGRPGGPGNSGGAGGPGNSGGPGGPGNSGGAGGRGNSGGAGGPENSGGPGGRGNSGGAGGQGNSGGSRGPGNSGGPGGRGNSGGAGGQGNSGGSGSGGNYGGAGGPGNYGGPGGLGNAGGSGGIGNPGGDDRPSGPVKAFGQNGPEYSVPKSIGGPGSLPNVGNTGLGNRAVNTNGITGVNRNTGEPPSTNGAIVFQETQTPEEDYSGYGEGSTVGLYPNRPLKTNDRNRNPALTNQSQPPQTVTNPSTGNKIDRPFLQPASAKAPRPASSPSSSRQPGNSPPLQAPTPVKPNSRPQLEYSTNNGDLPVVPSNRASSEEYQKNFPSTPSVKDSNPASYSKRPGNNNPTENKPFKSNQNPNLNNPSRGSNQFNTPSRFSNPNNNPSSPTSYEQSLEEVDGSSTAIYPGRPGGSKLREQSNIGLNGSQPFTRKPGPRAPTQDAGDVGRKPYQSGSNQERPTTNQPQQNYPDDSERATGKPYPGYKASPEESPSSCSSSCDSCSRPSKPEIDYAKIPGAVLSNVPVIFYPDCSANAFSQPAIVPYCPAQQASCSSQSPLTMKFPTASIYSANPNTQVPSARNVNEASFGEGLKNAKRVGIVRRARNSRRRL